MINAYRKQWINTKVEYQWSDELGELVEISKEGYWYEGEMSLCMPDTTISYNNSETDVLTGFAGGDEPGLLIKNENTTGKTYASQTFRIEGTADARIAGKRSVGNDSFMDLYFICEGALNSAGATILFLENTGKVGMGTIVPATNLHVQGTGSTEIKIESDDQNAVLTLDWDGVDDGLILFKESGSEKGRLGMTGVTERMFFKTAGTERLSILATGEIGIGNTTPTKDFSIKYDRSSTDIHGDGLLGGSAGSGVLIENSNHTANSFTSLDFRAGDADARIACVRTGNNISDFHFVLDNSGTANTAMSIMSTGNVGIGDTSPSYKLEVAGTFYSSGSSIEYKEEVEPYTPPEGALMGLKPVQYQYKDAWKDFGKRYSGNSSRQIGFVAEDVAKILPELAVTKSEDGKEVVRNVDYEKLTVLLVSEVQSLRKEVNDLRTSR